MSADDTPFLHPKEESSDKPPPVYYDRSSTPTMVGTGHALCVFINFEFLQTRGAVTVT